MKVTVHRVLVNRKTGKYSSAQDAQDLIWPLTVFRLVNRRRLIRGGIVSLLMPRNSKESKRLKVIDKSNKIIKKPYKSLSSTGDIRRKTRMAIFNNELIASLAVLYHDGTQPPYTIAKFSIWVKGELRDSGSKVSAAFMHHYPKLDPFNFAEKQSAWWERRIAARRKRKNRELSTTG